jgi:hypothetical protein
MNKQPSRWAQHELVWCHEKMSGKKSGTVPEVILGGRKKKYYF